MSHTLKWRPTRLLRTFSDELSGEELFESNLTIHSDRRFKDIDYIINDFTKVLHHSVTPKHTEVYATTDKIISETKHTLKIALVVPQGPLQVLAAGYCKLMRGQLFVCEVFNTVEDAKHWCRTTRA